MPLVSDAVYFVLMNFRNRLRGYALRTAVRADKLFEATHPDGHLVFARRIRYFYYKRGIQARLKSLAGQYLLERVTFSPGDVVIDCGANIGEVGLFLKDKQVDYHAFEPEELEANCCDLNNYGGKAQTNRKALWHENTVLKFYSNPDSADSSAFPSEDDLDVLEIPAVTLADYVSEKGLRRIRLAKIEAEGAEPEVLQGAIPVLNLIDYITVDCGFERGMNKEDTFEACNTLLKENGFSIICANLNRRSFLFARDELEADKS